MEENKQWKQLPFTIELAKKIQSGEIEGRIVTNHGKVVTLVDAAYGFNEEYWIPIIWHWQTEGNQLVLYNSKGECRNSHSDCYLHIELPKEELKHKFNVGDKVKIVINEKYPSTVGKVGTVVRAQTGSSDGHSISLYKVRLDGTRGALFGLADDECLEPVPDNEFKPFDKVLVRDNTGEKWVPDIFRYYDDNGNYDYPYRCCANDYRQCIPYTGNEHLLGTNNSPKRD